MTAPACSARVVLFAARMEDGLEARRRHPEYAHAFVVPANDPSPLQRMKGRTFAGWVLLAGAEHRASPRRLQELIEYAKRFSCGCSEHFPNGVA